MHQLEQVIPIARGRVGLWIATANLSPSSILYIWLTTLPTSLRAFGSKVRLSHTVLFTNLSKHSIYQPRGSFHERFQVTWEVLNESVDTTTTYIFSFIVNLREVGFVHSKPANRLGAGWWGANLANMTRGSESAECHGLRRCNG